MFANRYTAIVDACSLVGVLGRNLLLSLAEAEFFRLRWSPAILDETQAALAKMFAAKGKPSPESEAENARKQMEDAFPDALVTGFDHLLSLGAILPDSNDAHVLAAAIKTQAQAIITENLKDFPSEALGLYNLEARTLDDFVADTIALDEGRAVPAINRMRARLKRPELTADALLTQCEANSLLATADVLRPHLGSI